jgi:hypothetical protein
LDLSDAPTVVPAAQVIGEQFGDRIPRGKDDTLEVVLVRHEEKMDVIVVRTVHI